MKKVSAINIADKVLKSVLWVMLIIYCISLLATLGWVLINSLNETLYMSRFPLELPEKLNFENYAEVLYVFKMIITNKDGVKYEYGLLEMLIYSLIYSTGTAFVTVALYTMMAYVMAKYKFKGREFLYALGIFVMVTPIIGNTASMVQVREFFGIRDNMFLLIITSNSCAFAGLNFLLIYAACKRIPWDYAESAFVDGAGHMHVFYRIMLPMVIPSCAVVFVLQFLSVWNDYETFLVWLRFYPSLSLGLVSFRYQAEIKGIGTPIVMAAFVVAMIPTIILYLSSQKLILDKFQVGGLKG